MRIIEISVKSTELLGYELALKSVDDSNPQYFLNRPSKKHKFRRT